MGIGRQIKSGNAYVRCQEDTIIAVGSGGITLNGSPLAIGSPAGSNTQLQRNNAGVFGGISGATSDGTNVTFGSTNLRATSPRFTTDISDVNGNEVFKITATASAVNEFTCANAAAGSSPVLSATGGDTDIDVTFTPKGAGIVKSTNWFQNSQAEKRVSSDVTNATTTMGNVTGLSATLTAGRTYSFRLVLFVVDSVAADGIKVDFDGGTATATDFRSHGTLFDTALLLSQQTSALATDFVAGIITGDGMVEIYGTITVNAGGTFIVRAAQNAHTAGTLTIYRGSYLLLTDMA